MNEKNYFSLFLSFLLSILLLLLTAAMVVQLVFLNENRIMSSLHATHFHDAVYEQINDQVIDILLPSGLPNTVVDDVFTAELVYEHLTEYLAMVFAFIADGGEVPVLSYDALTEQLNQNIDRFLVGTNRSRAEIGHAAIDEIVRVVINAYDDLVRLPFVMQMARIIGLFQQLLFILIAVAGGVALLLMLIIYFTNRWKHIAVRYIAYGIGAAALMVTIAPLALRIWGGHHRLGISPEFIFDFAVFHIDRTISAFLFAGAIFIVLFAVLIVVSEKMRRRLKSRKS